MMVFKIITEYNNSNSDSENTEKPLFRGGKAGIIREL